jgi:Flp pilus assembly protein CpaB
VRRAAIELVLAVAAAVGCVASWLSAQSTVVVPPVSDGEPATTSVLYDPSWLIIAFMLGTLAGVLLVVGVGRWRRSRRSGASALRKRPHEDVTKYA